MRRRRRRQGEQMEKVQRRRRCRSKNMQFLPRSAVCPALPGSACFALLRSTPGRRQGPGWGTGDVLFGVFLPGHKWET
eukprot:gene17708-biopygen20397